MTKKKDPKDKLKVGRPLIIDEAIKKKLIFAFSMGETDENACKSVMISTKTLYNYCQKHPEFLQEKEKAKLNPVLKAKKTIYDSLGSPQVAMWYLERKRKNEFSTRQEIDANVNHAIALVEFIDGGSNAEGESSDTDDIQAPIN